jgi:metal-dependent amidase/aminoacylase/carboxypeptidase family protein
MQPATGADVANGPSSDLIAEAISWRRYLHQDPELAVNERQTTDFVASKLGLS